MLQPIKAYKDNAWRNCSARVFKNGAWVDVKYAWIFKDGDWRKVYDYTTNAILYGTSFYAFPSINGPANYQQTGLYAGYGVPGDWNQTNDGMIIYNGGYGSGNGYCAGQVMTPTGNTITIKCTCDNGGAMYVNQTYIGGAPHMSWAYYTLNVVPGDPIYVTIRNGGGSKYNGQVVKVTNADGSVLSKTDLSWVGATWGG